MLSTAVYFFRRIIDHARPILRGITSQEKHWCAERISVQSYSAEKAVSIITDPSHRLFHIAPFSIKDRPNIILATLCVQQACLCLAEATGSKYFPSVVGLVAPCCDIRPHAFET